MLSFVTISIFLLLEVKGYTLFSILILYVYLLDIFIYYDMYYIGIHILIPNIYEHIKSLEPFHFISCHYVKEFKKNKDSLPSENGLPIQMLVHVYCASCN